MEINKRIFLEVLWRDDVFQIVLYKFNFVKIKDFVLYVIVLDKMNV